jgi:hypothetical protein
VTAGRGWMEEFRREEESTPDWLHLVCIGQVCCSGGRSDRHQLSSAVSRLHQLITIGECVN